MHDDNGDLSYSFYRLLGDLEVVKKDFILESWTGSERWFFFLFFSRSVNFEVILILIHSDHVSTY